MRKFWEQDILQNIIVIEFLKRGADILAENKGAILVRDKSSGVICLSAIDEKSAADALEARSDYDLLLLSQPLMLRYVHKKYNLVCERPCFQGVYTKGNPLPLKGELEIDVADDKELEKIIATYEFADPEGLKKAQRRGQIFAAHADGQFCGYIGEHEEGSMGMLHVFPEFRGRGYAYELESFMINKKLSEGSTPYCHIIYDNAASLSLQKKLGLEIAAQYIFWAHKKDEQ